MTPLQRDILTVLRINPTPLMTAADIATVLNEWPGPRRTAMGIGSSLASIMNHGGLEHPLVSRKTIRSGRTWACRPTYDWASGAYYGYSWASLSHKDNYWFLKSRFDELVPHTLLQYMRGEPYGANIHYYCRIGEPREC